MKKTYLRIIDANLNRSREGLRVCEDISRFIVNDKAMTASFKLLRHSIASISKKIDYEFDILKARDSISDIGKKSVKSEEKRKNFFEVFKANIQRVEESLRVLEEVTKVIDSKSSEHFKKARFKLYTLEKKFIPKVRLAKIE